MTSLLPQDQTIKKKHIETTLSWLVVWKCLEHVLFCHGDHHTVPLDFHMFQRGGNQPPTSSAQLEVTVAQSGAIPRILRGMERHLNERLGTALELGEVDQGILRPFLGCVQKRQKGTFQQVY